jgi:hypothetical protein
MKNESESSSMARSCSSERCGRMAVAACDLDLGLVLDFDDGGFFDGPGAGVRDRKLLGY